VRVTGTAKLPASAAAGTLHVRLLDVSLVDAASIVLAEHTVRHPVREQPFTLSADLPADWHGSLDVAAHVDMVGDGRVHSGDLLTTMSYPVPPAGASDLVLTVSPVDR
jgi:uncharacterized lipoprotein YbaY